MSHAIAFDTLAFTKKLKGAGVPEEQAEIQAEAMMELVEGRLATKQDIMLLQRDIKALDVSLRHKTKELDVSLRHEMKELDVSLRHEMKELDVSLRHELKELDVSLRHEMKAMEMRITIRLGSMIVVAIGVVATLVKLL